MSCLNARRLRCGLVLALFTWLAWTVNTGAVQAAAADAVITNCSNDTQLKGAATAVGTTTITFACGAGETVIPINGRIEIQGNVTIRGGGRIVLDGGGTSAFFQVFNNAELHLRGVTLRNGRYNGGYPLENFGRLTLDDVRVMNNLAAADGGAVRNYGTLVVSSSAFISNTAGTPSITGSGGALYNDGGRATIADSAFTGNTAPNNLGGGGAIAGRNGGDITITNSRFNGNQAHDGGAVYVGAGTRMTITWSVFTSNQAAFGGAIESNGELQLDYSTVSGNEADNEGGGIWVLNSDLDMTYATVSGNTSGGNGGGISCYANTLSVIHSTISGNKTADKGGGIYSTCNLNLTNSTLSGNTAQSSGGGGIYQAGSGTATVAAATIARNSATFGAGVYNDGGGGSSMTLQYTLLANNTTGNCDGVVNSLGYNLSSDTNCANLTQTGDQQNVALPLGPLADVGGTTAVHLPLVGSPAINAIPTPCGVSVDQRGLARPQQGKCEIGAVELGVIDQLAIPVIRR